MQQPPSFTCINVPFPGPISTKFTCLGLPQACQEAVHLMAAMRESRGARRRNAGKDGGVAYGITEDGQGANYQMPINSPNNEVISGAVTKSPALPIVSFLL